MDFFEEVTKIIHRHLQCTQEVVDTVNEVLKTVSSLVRGGFVGSKAHMTLADLAFMATYSSLRASKLVDHKSFWYVEAWFKRCKNQVRESCKELPPMVCFDKSSDPNWKIMGSLKVL